MTVEELQVVITASTAGMQAELDNVSKRLNGLQSTTKKAVGGMEQAFKKIAPVIAGVFAVKKIIDFGRETTKAFNDTSVASAKLERVMKNTMGATSGHIENIKKLMANQELDGVIGVDVQLAGSQELGTYLGEVESLKKIIPIMNDMAAQQFGLGASAESVTNIATMLGKVMNGQVGALSRYGYSFTKAQEKILKFGTEAERAAVLVEVVGESVGGMNAALAQTPAGQLKQLQFVLDGVKSSIGEGIMSAVQAALPALNAMANMLLKVAQAFSAFMQSIFGKTVKMQDAQISSTQGQISAVEDWGDATEKAGKKAKGAAKGAVASFDELNQLNKASGKDDVGDISIPSLEGGDLGLGNLEVSINELGNKFQDMLEGIKTEFLRLGTLFQKGFSVGIGGDYQSKIDSIKKSVASIKESLKDIFTDSEVVNAASTMVESLVTNFGKATGALASVGLTIAQNLTGGIAKYLEENSQFIKDRLVGMFNIQTKLYELWGEFSETFAEVFSAFGSDTAQQVTANIIGMFSNGFLGVLELAMKFTTDVIEMIVRPFVDNKDRIFNAIMGTLEAVEVASGTLRKAVTDTMKKVLEVYEEYLRPAFDNITDGISMIVGAVLDSYSKYIQPTLAKMADAWNKIYTDSIKPMVDKALVLLGKLIEMISRIWKDILAPFLAWVTDLWGPGIAMVFEMVSTAFGVVVSAIADLVKGLLQILEGIIDFMMGVFTGDWDRAWQGIKGIVKGVMDTLYNLTIGPLSKIMGWVTNTFALGWKNAWEGMSKVFKGVFDGLVYLAKIPLNFIIDMVNKAIGGFNKMGDAANKIPGVKVSLIRDIPKLARGGIVDGPTLAMVGEAGKEAVVPLENNTQWLGKMASMVTGALLPIITSGGGGGGTSSDGTPYVIEVDGVEMARGLLNPLQREAKRQGVTFS